MLDVAGPTEQELPLLESTLAALPEDGPPRDAARLLCARAFARVRAGMIEDGERDAIQVEALVSEEVAPDLHAWVALSRGYAAIAGGDGGHAEASLRRAIELGRGEQRIWVDALNYLAYTVAKAGRLEEGRVLFDEAQAAAHQHGLWRTECRALANRGLVEHAAGDLTAARRSDQRCLDLALEGSDTRNEIPARLQLGMVLAELGRLDEARAQLAPLARASQRVAGRQPIDAVAMLTGVVDALSGELDEAARAFERARRHHSSAGWAYQQQVSDVLETLVDVERARVRLAASDAEGAEAAFEAARERVEAVRAGGPDGAPSSHDRSIRCRIAVGMVERAIARLQAAVPLVISPDARRFRAPRGEEVVLGRRRAIRGLLGVLVERRLGRPGEVVTLAELRAAGWPGERMRTESGVHRLHVAISELRKLGLREVLLTHPDGYLLDPAVPVRRASTRS
jgi:tetratricopeptide (TPR) repeat protein